MNDKLTHRVFRKKHDGIPTISVAKMVQTRIRYRSGNIEYAKGDMENLERFRIKFSPNMSAEEIEEVKNKYGHKILED